MRSYSNQKSSVLPSLVRTLVTTLLYMSLISPTYFVGTLCLSKAHHITFFGILSYAFSKSMKTMCMKPNWFIETHVILLKRCSITLSHSFIVWFINLISR
ncbi:hypothetical protein SETIT_2G210100v2 [Setaria italica]|uniref:Uncharacterized protein n=1 Tax=Setaria italica TaxID=4555 RepID=A0A368Q149_SETIT|nr:hypothetical protein SETIT_2G210100v2 [Setaria italica]